MITANEITKVFAYSETPHVVLSCDSPYIVVAANPAYFKWVDSSAENILQTSIFSVLKTIFNLTGLSNSSLIQLFEKVVNTKTAIKFKVNSSFLPGEIIFTTPASYVLEVFPIIDRGKVINLVLKVDSISDTIPVEPILTNCGNQSALSTYQLLPLILDSLTNVIFVLDVESPGIYKFSYANRAFQVTTGVPVSKVIGSYVQEIIPEPSLSMVLQKYQEAIHLQQQLTWTEVSDYPNGQKTAEVTVVPVLDPNCNCWRLVGMVHDITPHVEAEARQTHLAQDLFQHNRDLQQFTYILSHNLRAPVAYAVGLTRLLSEVDKTSKEFNTSLAYLKESVHRLDDILKDLNLILSIRDKRDMLELENIPLNDICQQVLSDLSELLNQCNGQLQLEIEKGTCVQAYRAYLYSIFYNLLLNAIKYRSDARSLQVIIKAVSQAEGGTIITIADNGTGFDLHKASDKVFQLYKRFHPTIEGKGIGLFLVKTHVEALGGQIEVNSQVEVGTTFIIHLK